MNFYDGHITQNQWVNYIIIIMSIISISVAVAIVMAIPETQVEGVSGEVMLMTNLLFDG